MAKITVEEIYRGDKFNVMGEAVKDYLIHGKPKGYDEQTFMEMLIVKHTLIAAEKIFKEGGSISGLTE